MKTCWRVLAGLAAILSLGSIPLDKAWSANWPIEEFQVLAREPTSEEISVVSKGPGMLAQLLFPEDGSIRQPLGTGRAERWFNEIGGRYRQAGIRPPLLGPVVEDNGTSKYRVYIFPYTGSRTRDGLHAGGTYETNSCFNNNKVSWLSINYNMDGGLIPREKFWTIGHEMMHSLMFGDYVYLPCNRNSFEVSEGIPDGAGMYLTNRKYPGYSGRINYSGSAVGLRSYKMPLYIFEDVPESKKSRLEIITGYGTSSFWYFLIERFGGLRIFPIIFEAPIKHGASKEDMYRWLDQRLQAIPWIGSTRSNFARRESTEPPGLYEVYPAFISEFASYGGSRYMNFNWWRIKSPQLARNAWLNKVFGGCRRVNLSPEKMTDSFPLDIEPNAARCIQVIYEGFSGNVTAHVEVLDNRLAMLDQIHLGWAWKIARGKEESCYEKRKSVKSKWPPCTYKAFSQTGPQIGHYARTWPVDSLDFGESGNGTAEQILVFSNVAVKPWMTKEANSLIAKIAVSRSTMNDKPAEPIEQQHVPRDRKEPVVPTAPRGKKAFYGLQTDPPLPESGIKGIKLHPYTPNRSKGAKALPGGYGVGFSDLKYGKTGPVSGIVTWDSDKPGAVRGIISSSFCKDPSKPVGQVIQSDENTLRISIDVDLCEAGPRTLKQCETACPVVDHLSAEVNTAFGWRQFSETAPTDIITPGVQRYINSMPETMQEMMDSFSNTELPDFDYGTGTGDSGTAESKTPGVGAASGGALAACACSCEEKAATEARAEAWKRQVDAGKEPSMAELGDLMHCSSSCQTEYTICAMEAADAEKLEEERLAREKAEAQAAKCDCSCAAIDRLVERASDLEKQFVAGGGISNEEIFQMSTCMTSCQQEMLSCAMNK